MMRRQNLSDANTKNLNNTFGEMVQVQQILISFTVA